MYKVYADGNLIYFPSSESYSLISPKLTLEVGKAGSFSFGLPSVNLAYNSIRRFKTEIVVERDNTELFRGRVIEDPKIFDNTKNIYCEGDLAYLMDSVQKNEAYTGTAHAFFSKVITAHNARVEEKKQFTVGEVTIEDRSIVIAGKIDAEETSKFDYKQIAINATTNDWKSTYDYINDTLIAYCGGYLRTRRENGVNYIDLLADSYGEDIAQSIDFGVNLLDLNQSISVDDFFTVLVPLGDENLTIASVNNGSDELVNEELVAEYGRILKTHTFDSVSKASTLMEDAQRYLELHSVVDVSFEVKAIDLNLLDSSVDQFLCGHKIHLNSRPHGVTEYLTCTKIEYDLQNASNDTYTIGNPKQSLTERYRKDIQQSVGQSCGGDSASSGGGGGGGGHGGSAAAAAAAAEVAEETAEETTEEKLGDFYNAYINLDESAGTISLGALYKKYEDDRYVFENKLGIDLDAQTGFINLESTKNELTDKINTNTGKISINSQSIDAVVQRTGQLGDNIAEIKISLDDIESAIALKADRVTVEGLATELNSETTTINGKIANLNSEITYITHAMITTAEIEELIADRVTSNELVAELMTGTITKATYLKATNTIEAPKIKASAFMYIGDDLVATQKYVDAHIQSALESYIPSVSWSDIINKPSTFRPSSHTHSFSGTGSLSSTFGSHTHRTNIGGTLYESTRVYQHSSDVTVSVSGTTGGVNT